MVAIAKPKRLFDFLSYQGESFPLEDMLAAREEGAWRKYSTHEVGELVNQLSVGLLQAGLSAGDHTPAGRDKVAILSPNRPEWLIADLAIQQIGLVSVPIYPTITDQELLFILQDASVRLVFAGNKALYKKAVDLQDRLPDLKAVYSFEQLPGALFWQDLLAELSLEAGKQLEHLQQEVKETDLVTILYTSGTTGTPKGVMLSHYNMVSNVYSSVPVLEEIGLRGQRALSFLPLNHAFERMATYCFLYSGVSIYYAEGLEKIGENLREVRPAVFTTVPRLLEKIYEGIMSKGSKLTGIQRRLFDWALRLGEQYGQAESQTAAYRLQLALARKLVFSKWRQALGGQVKAIITGAAACQIRLLRVFTAAGIVIQEGYGLTEASPIISANRYSEQNRRFGTVGLPVDQVTVRFGDDGEILVKGPNVMMGYFKRPDLTAEVLEGEWLHTGDIGSLEEGRFLKITDRKKELFKTSGGKYVAPQPIENKLAESDLIAQVMVVGESQKFVGALIVPAFRALKDWYAGQGEAYPGNEAAVQDARVRALIRKAINKFNPEINPVEQVKKFELLPQEWSIEGGELTPTLKLRRKVIAARYSDTITRIYE